MIVGGDTAAAYAADDGSFALNVRRTEQRTDEYGKPVWRYAVYVNGALLAQGVDLYGWGDGREMLATLADFLGHDAEVYSTYMGPVPEWHDDYVFGENVAEWAYGVSDELSMVRYELGGDDE